MYGKPFSTAAMFLAAVKKAAILHRPGVPTARPTPLSKRKDHA
jgi:hypothetical protein